MKISNLYVGDIYVVAKEFCFDENKDKVCQKRAIKSRRTIFQKLNKKTNKVEDLIYGGIYSISNLTCCEIGDEYADNLTQTELLNVLNYNKKFISKKKLLNLLTGNHRR